MKPRRTPLSVLLGLLSWAVLLFFLAVAVLPLLWLLFASFKTTLEIESGSFGLPKVWRFANYAEALTVSRLPRMFFNSALVAVSAVVLNLAVTSMAGFVLSREKFRGRETVHTALTAGVLVPIIAFLVPYFILVTRLRLYDNLAALVLVYAAVNIPVSVFLVTSFMKAIPKELEEAAVIDGCGFFQRYWKMILPLSQSGLVTAGTFCFIYAWNEFVLAMLFTSSEATRTIQLGIRFFQTQFLTDYGPMFAAIVISMVPTVLVYVFLHDRIIAGMTAGSVKG